MNSVARARGNQRRIAILVSRLMRSLSLCLATFLCFVAASLLLPKEGVAESLRGYPSFDRSGSYRSGPDHFLLDRSRLLDLPDPQAKLNEISNRPLGAAGFVYPLLGTRVSSDFGKRRHPVLGVPRHHAGIDLAAPYGAAVRAIADGVVAFADPRGGYGNLVVVVHGDGHSSHYGHLQSIAVKPGSWVKAGQLVGRVGSSGISSGPHLHFEIRYHGKALDPETVLPGLAALGEG